MHYYGTYALARAAGFKRDAAQAIATASEYVDDSDELHIKCKDGFEIHAEATAHHPSDYSANTDPQDQRRTWVPFHFIPGALGASDEERLVCVTDSAVARALVAHTLDSLGQPFGLPLLGILAHSFADTFSHYGFSGISSRLNRVDARTLKIGDAAPGHASVVARMKLFADKYVVGPLANHLAQLGHGSVATFPDQPYLNWEFSYSDPLRPSGPRPNPQTFLQACRRLHEVFTAARAKFNGVHDDPAAARDFAEIEPAVQAIQATAGEAGPRADAWQQASRDGKLGRVAEAIPAYGHRRFTGDLERLANYDQAAAVHTPVCRFLQAADFHRDYVLKELLPSQGIQVEAIKIDWQG